MGMFAMNSCRLEKGFRHFGHDIGEGVRLMKRALALPST
ncbi:hypothetical protein ACFQFQ_24040 [Sulfitobacter porphyrae]|uniref:Transposase n=1 Tax=Sulfitobacter porphyrae TaxID=1246864 RepID=A0ABW2BA05_9RHOB